MTKEKTIAERLKRVRLDLDLSLQQMAVLLKYKNKSSMAQLETGYTSFPTDKLSLLCTYLGIASDWLLGLDENRFTDKSLGIAEHALYAEIMRLTEAGGRKNFTCKLLEYLKVVAASEVEPEKRARLIYLMRVGYLPILSCLAGIGLSPDSLPEARQATPLSNSYILSNKDTQVKFCELHRVLNIVLAAIQAKKLEARESGKMNKEKGFKIKSHIFKGHEGLVYPSIYAGYVLALEAQAEEQRKVFLIPEEAICFKDTGLALREEYLAEIHDLGYYTKASKLPELVSLDEHAYCNPLLFMDEITDSFSVHKAEMCNFGYQVERLRADGLKLKDEDQIKIAVSKAGSYCFLDEANRINYYVAKEASIYEDYTLARAVYYEAKKNYVRTIPCYELVANAPGSSSCPLDVSPLGFIFSEKFMRDGSYRQEIYGKLQLEPATIAALRTIFADMDAKLKLVMRDETKDYVKEFLAEQ